MRPADRRYGDNFRPQTLPPLPFVHSILGADYSRTPDSSGNSRVRKRLRGRTLREPAESSNSCLEQFPTSRSTNEDICPAIPALQEAFCKLFPFDWQTADRRLQ